MNQLKYFDFLLGEAAERLVKATDVIKTIETIDTKQNLIMLGRVISGIWSVRSEIYKTNPEIKTDFVKEYEQDEKRYQKLSSMAKKAIEMESAGNIDSAKVIFQELYTDSNFGHFRLIAEAGLFRTKSSSASGSRSSKDQP